MAAADSHSCPADSSATVVVAVAAGSAADVFAAHAAHCWADWTGEAQQVVAVDQCHSLTARLTQKAAVDAEAGQKAHNY